MKNVLHILSGDDGGITAVVKNFYKNIDKNKIHFDIACTTNTEGNDIASIKNMGARIYHLPMKVNGLHAYTESLKNILNNKSYDAIHVHETETSYIALRIAKKYGIKCRIAHSHSTAPYTTFKNEIRRLSGVILNYHYATTVMACGEMSGNRIFGKFNMKRKKALVLSNAIDIDKFKYNCFVRNSLREQLELSDKCVVGFIGRLEPQKNPIFSLKIIELLHKINPNAVLMIVGDGIEESKIRMYIEEHNLKDCVRLLGKRTDVECLYQVFDAFILPSFYEGFPLVAVEALASGLPTFLSTGITPEFSFSKSVTYLNIDNADQWATAINSSFEGYKRTEHLNELNPEVFDIKCVIKRLENIYLSEK